MCSLLVKPSTDNNKEAMRVRSAADQDSASWLSFSIVSREKSYQTYSVLQREKPFTL